MYAAVTYKRHTQTVRGLKLVTNKIRTHLDEDINKAIPAHIMKEEFAKRVYRFMTNKGWTQSELARKSDLPRDSISSYVRGASMPTPKSLAKLAAGLGVDETELVPNHVESAIERDSPMIEVRISPNARNTALLRINAIIPADVALKIQEMVLNATQAAS